MACWAKARHRTWSTSCAVYCGIHGPLLDRTYDVVRRSVCRQLALMYSHSAATGIPPCHTGTLGYSPALHVLKVVHTWAVGIVPCHTMAGWVKAQHRALSTSWLNRSSPRAKASSFPATVCSAVYHGIHSVENQARLRPTSGVVRRRNRSSPRPKASSFLATVCSVVYHGIHSAENQARPRPTSRVVRSTRRLSGLLHVTPRHPELQPSTTPGQLRAHVGLLGFFHVTQMVSCATAQHVLNFAMCAR
ncbi:uncharacterized protein [Dermacentor albipictus]|uniref:uncharacterized protein isoform X5 n=1 Tax=Dermacentor albipictus TaxID=60249 RepID=UPI0038FCB05C